MRANSWKVRRVKARPRHEKGKMNGTEAAYASVLMARKLAGEIDRFDFEPEKLRLANNTYFEPDFRVITIDGFIEFHEVKACDRDGNFLCEDDARVKWKVAAEQHPMYGFRMCGRLAKSAGWKIESLNCE